MKIPFKQTPNYSIGKEKKIGWCIHGTLGAYKGAVEWLSNGNRENRSSAHFVIGRNEGEIIQLCKISDVAWHAGNVSNPNERARKVLPKKLDGTYDNPNKFFVGVEMAWGYDVNGDGKITAIDKTLTEWQLKALCELIQASQSEVPLKADTILTHTDIASYKGDNLSDVVQEVIKRIIPPIKEEMIQVMVPKSKLEKVLKYMNTI